MQGQLFESIPCDKYDLLTREDAIELAKGYADAIRQLQTKLEEQNKKLLSSEQVQFLLNEQVLSIKNKLFGKSSEKSPRNPPADKPKKDPRKRVLLPSERYPELDVIEKFVTLDTPPTCKCCNKEMKDSGLTEDSEYLTVIPRRYYVALSKYCDLIPIERYVQMAQRGGVPGLPANGLIQGTHNLADFLAPVYRKIKSEVMSSKILHADETPHRMLEGDEKSQWYLWGFSTGVASYFEAQDTRSGSVAADLLKDSACEFLMSDVFSGYAKAVTDSNVYRRENHRVEIKNIYCNAHARRKFKEAEDSFPRESAFFIACYRKIYRLEKDINHKDRRQWQRLYYRAMERMGLKLKSCYSMKSSLTKAINYLLNNFEELTYFLRCDELPIDNNAQERLMRAPVVGRKTWYGTHSRRGAQTNAVLFSLVESCKLNGINPRDYFRDIVHAIHEKRPEFTPAEYARTKSANPA